MCQECPVCLTRGLRLINGSPVIICFSSGSDYCTVAVYMMLVIISPHKVDVLCSAKLNIIEIIHDREKSLVPILQKRQQRSMSRYMHSCHLSR